MGGDSDFKSIQEAIGAAKDGDVIEVLGGVYKENVLVNKSLTLRGVGEPVIDAGGNGSSLRLDDNGIVAEGFSLMNSGEYDSGIEIRYVTAAPSPINISIRNNNITHNSEGISIHSSDNIIVLNNTISHNKFSGIHLERSRLCSVSENTIRSNGQGIYLIASAENRIQDNLIQGNEKEGILLSSYLSEYGPYGFSDNNTITGNDIRDNEYGILQRYSENCTINNNTFINNTQNISSNGRSRSDVGGDASAFVAIIYGVIYILVIFLTIINYVILILIGLAAGFVVKTLLKDRMPSMLANLAIGAIGSLIGYFVYAYLVLDYSVAAYLISAASAAALVILSGVIWINQIK